MRSPHRFFLSKHYNILLGEFQRGIDGRTSERTDDREGGGCLSGFRDVLTSPQPEVFGRVPTCLRNQKGNRRPLDLAVTRSGCVSVCCGLLWLWLARL